MPRVAHLYADGGPFTRVVRRFSTALCVIFSGSGVLDLGKLNGARFCEVDVGVGVTDRR